MKLKDLLTMLNGLGVLITSKNNLINNKETHSNIDIPTIPMYRQQNNNFVN